MNRTHWVKTAAGLGAACFITIGMGFSGTDASAMTTAGVLDNYYDAGVSVGAGTSSKIVHQEDHQVDRIENLKDIKQYITRIDEIIHRKELKMI